MSEYDNDEAKLAGDIQQVMPRQFVIKNDFNAGEFVWTGFDYIGEPTPWNGTGAGSASGQELNLNHHILELLILGDL